MRSFKSFRNDRFSSGFTLPVILVLVAGLLILTIGVLWLVGIEGKTARAFVDGKRADLAVTACLENLFVTLNQDLADDDFLIIQAFLEKPTVLDHERSPYLFAAHGAIENKLTKFSYVSLFSTQTGAAELPKTDILTIPDPAAWLSLLDSPKTAQYSTARYRDPVRVAWIPIKDFQGRQVSRYAYWVEDLQSKLDPQSVGNLTGKTEPLKHVREPYPFSAPGLNAQPESATQPPLDQIALYAVVPKTTATEQGPVAQSLLEHRVILVSPDSLLAAAVPEIALPLACDTASGRLTDPQARAVEEDLATQARPYLERPMIPFIAAINPTLAASPQKNLNALLAKPATEAVTEMADFIALALPDFESRRGGLPDPESYVKTLAANAIDYADQDSEPTILAGTYRGLDAAPLLSESSIQINYLGMSQVAGRYVMKFKIKLFAELHNSTNQAITAGQAQLSYEVGLYKDGIGAGVDDDPFDSASILDDSAKATHSLTKIDGIYWSPEVAVILEANQYRAFQFAEVNYQLDQGPTTVSVAKNTPFSLLKSKFAGMSLRWNGQVIDRSHSIVRQQGLVYSPKAVGSGFQVWTAETITKSCIPGLLSEAASGAFLSNLGDPRIAYYMRTAAFAESAYPENCSPNRRNIRLDIYNADSADKLKVHARVMPSEWPDGGHNCDVGDWNPGISDKTELTDDKKFGFVYQPEMRFSAPQAISNRGYFLSTTELGRLFDPIMYQPKFASASATKELIKNHKFSGNDISWPDVAVNNPQSNLYGGGNSLRMGRPEHPEFSQLQKPSMRASHLLDLFHVGLSRSALAEERQGPLIRIQGHINLNTATRNTLRAMAAGSLVMDPLLSSQTSNHHLGAPTMSFPKTALTLSAPSLTIDADRIADAVIRSRPYPSRGSLALAKEEDDTPVFGNKKLYPDAANIEWSDAAAEEVFARVFEASTVRSRNFRVWVIAQAVAPRAESEKAEVLSEVRKVFNLFVEPGERAADGAIVSGKVKTRIISSNDF